MGGVQRDRQLTLHPFFLASARAGEEEGRDLQVDALLAEDATVAKDAPAPSVTVDRLTTLPAELLLMIFGQLDTSSLLQASRVSKLFRRTLCTKSAEKIWRRARLEEGWTDLEAGDWNEMQYAQFIDGRECQICGDGAWTKLKTKRRMKLRACVCDDCNLIRHGDDLWNDYPHLHGSTFDCVGFDPDTDEFLIPELLEQSGQLSLLEAKALRSHQDTASILQDYQDSRESYLDMVTKDAARNKRVCSRSDDRIRRSTWRRYCIEQLAGLGYLPEDYAFLHDDDWWCWCSATVMADDEIDDDMVAAEMSRTQDFDLEAVGDEEYYQLLDTARTRHANCLRFPEIFWYYWEEDSVDEWDEDNSPEAEEWVELGALYVRLSQRNKEARLRRVQDAARQIRRQKLRPLFEGLRQQTAQRQTSHFFSFWYFCVGLKSIERLWLPDSAAAKSAPSPVIERFLVRDACDKAHEEKVRLFLRIARALLEDDTKTAALPESVASMLEYVDSRITDSKQTDVFRSYCLGILGDDEMDPIFARATALFRCGFCSSTFTYPDIANHLVEMHEAGPVTAYAHVPAPCFRRAVKDLLVEMKLPLTTTSSDLADYRFEVEEQSGSGVTITFCDQSWLDVLAGKANCEMAGERRNFDGEKTERAITAIRPTRNSVLSQNLGTS